MWTIASVSVFSQFKAEVGSPYLMVHQGKVPIMHTGRNLRGAEVEGAVEHDHFYGVPAVEVPAVQGSIHENLITRNKS